MSFWYHIESKSSSVKSRYAFGVAGAVTMLIAVVWVSTLPARFAQKDIPEITKGEDTKGFSQLLSDTKNQLGNIIEGTKKTEVPQVETENMDALGDAPVSEVEGTFQDPTKSPEVTNTAGMEDDTLVTETPKEKARVILIGTSTNSQ